MIYGRKVCDPRGAGSIQIPRPQCTCEGHDPRVGRVRILLPSPSVCLCKPSTDWVRSTLTGSSLIRILVSARNSLTDASESCVATYLGAQGPVKVTQTINQHKCTPHDVSVEEWLSPDRCTIQCPGNPVTLSQRWTHEASTHSQKQPFRVEASRVKGWGV